MNFTETDIENLVNKHPILKDIMEMKSVFWENPNLTSINDVKSTNLGVEDIRKADELWDRFAPFFVKEFPEQAITKGVIESPLKKISKFSDSYDRLSDEKLAGDLFLKCDNELPIAGSIKARGGFYEVLKHAEELAMKMGKISKGDNYEKFSSPSMKEFFSNYTIGVGSTGNLGLSIGIMSAALGFQVEVFMSRDAEAWKKTLLREKGAIVHEFSGDFSVAIAIGRDEIKQRENSYFVDDEDSLDLFLGYATAGIRLAKQLKEKEITVDAEHPLFLYLPCGVGGSPGGVAFGAKHILGDHVHCFFAEPLHSPSVLSGLVTQHMSDISVNDIGLDNKTDADGLAVGRSSRFATPISDELVNGIFTMSDEILYKVLSLMVDTEDIKLEPAAASGLLGPAQVLQTDYVEKHDINPENITHIAWATGGALIPPAESTRLYDKGKALWGN